MSSFVCFTQVLHELGANLLQAADDGATCAHVAAHQGHSNVIPSLTFCERAVSLILAMLFFSLSLLVYLNC